MSSTHVLAVLLIAVTVLAYVPALRAGFIWDDDSYVYENPQLRSGQGLTRIWFEPAASPQYYPLVFTSFWIEYHAWGLDPAGYHLVNVLLHALAAVLLWGVLRELELPGAWLIAAVFALHPVHVESVAWITERKNVLSAVFYLGAAWCLLRYFAVGEEETSGRRCRAWYAVGATLFACALLSKTVTASLPAAVLLILWWKRGAVRPREVAALVPLFLAGLTMGLATAWLERHHVGAQGLDWQMGIAERTLVAGRAIWFYAGKLVWPFDLVFNYPRWSTDAANLRQWIFPAGVALVVVGLWLTRNRLGRGPLVAVLFFCGTLFPALGFFDVYPFRYSFVADHFQYLASIGLLALAVGAVAARAVDWSRPYRGAAFVAAGLLLVLLGIRTWDQSRDYRDVESLWVATLAKNPQSWMAHNNLGKQLARQDRLEEAITHFRTAIRLRPENDKAYHNLGVALATQGRAEEAIDAYSEAVRFNPDNSGAQVNLGNLLAGMGRYEEATAHYTEALRILPDSAEVHNNLANALAGQGRYDAAIEHYEAALRLDPDYAMARENLSVVRELRDGVEADDR